MAEKKQGKQGSSSIERAEQPIGIQRGGGAGYGGTSPFGLMRRMMEDMDRLFGDFGLARSGSLFDELEPIGGARTGSYGPSLDVWNPQLEVFERGGKLVARADLPGVSKDDVHVQLHDDALVIEGERKSEQEKEEEGYYHSERSYGSFQRRIPLPRGIDVSSCDASFEDGVLEITLDLPKEQGQNVEIRSGKKTEAQPKGAQAQQGASQNGGREVPKENGTQAQPSRH